MKTDRRSAIEIIRTVKEEWVSVTGAHLCMCGHTHHGRQLYRDGVLSNLAPQYNFCDEDCGCTALRMKM